MNCVDNSHPACKKYKLGQIHLSNILKKKCFSVPYAFMHTRWQWCLAFACPSDCLSVAQSLRWTVCSQDCLSVRLSVRATVCPQNCLSVRPSVRCSLSVGLSACRTACPFDCLSVRLSALRTACLFDCLVRCTISPLDCLPSELPVRSIICLFHCLFDYLSVQLSDRSCTCCSIAHSTIDPPECLPAWYVFWCAYAR